MNLFKELHVPRPENETSCSETCIPKSMLLVIGVDPVALIPYAQGDILKAIQLGQKINKHMHTSWSFWLSIVDEAGLIPTMHSNDFV